MRRGPGEQALVVQCRPCGLSTTKTIEAPKPGENIHLPKDYMIQARRKRRGHDCYGR